jgi:YVTN family beta-propeller protein
VAILIFLYYKKSVIFMTESRHYSISGMFRGINDEDVAIPNLESNEIYLIHVYSDKKATKIKVGTGPLAVTYSESFIYVANSGSNDVSVIDNKTNQVVNTVKVGNAPSALAYYSGIHNIYVANSGSNDVSVIHEDHSVRGGEGPIVQWPVFVTKNVGTGPSGIAYNPYNNLVYVANSGSNDVSVIREYDVLTTVKVGTGPLAIAPGGFNSTYVANSSSNDVSVIDNKTNQVVNTVKVGNAPSSIAFSSPSELICVANSSSNDVSVLHTAKNVVAYTIQVSDPFSLSSFETSDNIYLAAGTPMKLYALGSKDLQLLLSHEYPISNIARPPDGIGINF